jgi:hypothetical protein
MGEFKNWLMGTTEMKTKSARDVVSRLERLRSFMTIDTEKIDFPHAVLEMESRPEYKALSPRVQPQLKRALKLYYRFKNKQV